MALASSWPQVPQVLPVLKSFQNQNLVPAAAAAFQYPIIILPHTRVTRIIFILAIISLESKLALRPRPH